MFYITNNKVKIKTSIIRKYAVTPGENSYSQNKKNKRLLNNE